MVEQWGGSGDEERYKDHRSRLIPPTGTLEPLVPVGKMTRDQWPGHRSRLIQPTGTLEPGRGPKSFFPPFLPALATMVINKFSDLFLNVRNVFKLV